MSKPKLPTVRIKKEDVNKEVIFDNTSPYASWCYNFAACSEIKKGEVRQLFDLCSCREAYIGRVIDLMKGGGNSEHYSTRKTTLFIWQHPGDNSSRGRPTYAKRETLENFTTEAMQTSIKIVNRFADEGGWLKSKLFRADLPKSTKSIVHVIEGSRWWSTAPQTLSLYLLLIRLGKRPELRKIKANTPMADVIKILNKMSGGGSDDYHIVQPELWPVLIQNRAAIYRNRKFSTNFLRTSGSTDGLKYLTLGNCNDDTIQKRFDKLRGK